MTTITKSHPAMIYDCFKGWVTLDEAARHLGISRRGVLAYVDYHRTEVMTARIGERLTLVYLPSLEECREAGKIKRQKKRSFDIQHTP